MIRIVTGFLLCVGLLYGEAAPKLNERYEDSSKCQPCHSEKVKEWSHSWHSRSHYKNNEYLRKSIDYVARKTRKSVNTVKVECAVCHNPRIGVTSTSTEYEIIAAMGLDKNSEVNQAVNSDSLSEGINCLVCHNVDKIDHAADASVRGAHRLKWNEVGVMSGPLDNAKSPYHKTQSRKFFKEDVNKLCFVCHANDRSQAGVVFTNMEKEMVASKKVCADCHMSPKKPGVASNLPIDNGKPKQRMVREHGFVGAHVEWLWEGALSLEGKKSGNDLIITIKNPQPHNLPSGFGARELLVEVTYKTGSKTLETKTTSLTQKYVRRGDKPTIPHLAEAISQDISIPANGAKALKMPWAKGAGAAEVNLYYRLVNDEVRSLLKLQEPIWSKKMFIDKAVVRP